MKKNNTYFLLSLVFALLVSVSTFGQSYTAKKITIPGSTMDNVYEIDNNVYRSEQPTAADFKAMQKFGIHEVLNLRNRHSDVNEAKGTKIILYRVKMKAHHVTYEKIIEALRIIKNRKGPIVFHCHHGSDRTGVLCAMYRIVFQNIPKEEAIREMKEGGFGFHRIYSNLTRLIQNADVEYIRQEVFAK